MSADHVTALAKGSHKAKSLRLVSSQMTEATPPFGDIGWQLALLSLGILY
jgi:hypothetical protein